MRGRLRPYLPELTIRDYNIYQRYTRGVRRQLYKEYGLFSCWMLHHHGVVYAILADSLAGRPATCRVERLPGTLIRAPLMCQTKGIWLAARMEILMSWHRLQECKWQDLRFYQKLRWAVHRLLLHRAYCKAAQEVPALERLFRQEKAQIEAQMELHSKDYALAAEPMSNVFGALYSSLAPDDATARKNMRYIGCCIGRAFYLLDKAEGYLVDKRYGRYNVFIENGLSREEADANAHRQAIDAVNDLARVYSMMDIKLNRSLLGNIMILGLRNAVDPLEYGGEWTGARWELP